MMTRNRKCKAMSVAKLEQGNVLCEDAALATPAYVVVSDGAGGGGVYADEWARYLVENTTDNAITSFEQFKDWLEHIWEKFYLEHEQRAQQYDGMLLNKYYDEGSFATYVAGWIIAADRVQWVAYGDSVLFLYDYTTKELQHSFTKLDDFAKPPALVNWKEEVVETDFRCGTFVWDRTHKVTLFACSDALAHYILMTYLIDTNRALNIDDTNKNINLLHTAQHYRWPFEQKVLKPLLNALRDNCLHDHCRKLYNLQLLALDDYSLARLL
ncbi:MAG: hypothetical protein ACI30H_05940 [Paludibacteraceae bacterium]